MLFWSADKSGKATVTAEELKSSKFITVEGVEGAGKSAQLERLAEEFRSREIPFVATREPGGTLFGQQLRRVLLYKEGPTRQPITELLLYLADRFQHLREVIEPALSQGQHVISDRYHDATLAYQGHARDLGFSVVDSLAEILAIRMPDLTLFLDVEVSVGLQRARSRNARENQEMWSRFEQETLDFHHKVREGYHRLAKRDPERIRVIDATGSFEEVFQQVLIHLRRHEVL